MSFLIRFLHVAAVSYLLGGALLVALLMCSPLRNRLESSPLLAVAQAYEWGFWGAIGVVVMTGAGNLGAFGEALPGPRSVWGERFSIKLALVLALLAFSLLRTMVVVLSQPAGGSPAPGGVKQLPAFYAGTAVLLAAIAGLATALAHF